MFDLGSTSQELDLANIDTHPNSGRVSLENGQLVVIKSTFFGDLGYSIWAIFKPKLARSYEQKVQKEVIKKIQEHFKAEILHLDPTMIQNSVPNHFDLLRVKSLKTFVATLVTKEIFKNPLPEQQKIFRPILETFQKDILQRMKQKQGNLFKIEDYVKKMQEFQVQLSSLIEEKKEGLTFLELSQKCAEFRNKFVEELEKPATSTPLSNLNGSVARIVP